MKFNHQSSMNQALFMFMLVFVLFVSYYCFGTSPLTVSVWNSIKLPAVMSFMCMCVLYATNNMGQLIEKRKWQSWTETKCDYFSYAAKMNGRQSKFQQPSTILNSPCITLCSNNFNKVKQETVC